jgi:hypothetical protein
MTTHPAGPAAALALAPIMLYAYVSSSGEVVYVGRTCNPPARDARHRCDASWHTPDLTFSMIDEVVGWTASVRAEARAIRELRPTANIRCNRAVA